MEKVFLDKFKGNLAFNVPCMGFILSQELEDGLTNGGEFGNKLADVL